MGHGGFRKGSNYPTRLSLFGRNDDWRPDQLLDCGLFYFSIGLIGGLDSDTLIQSFARENGIDLRGVLSSRVFGDSHLEPGIVFLTGLSIGVPDGLGDLVVADDVRIEDDPHIARGDV